MGFTDLPRESFPVQMTGLGPDGTVIWERTIEPYEVVEIPPAPRELRGKVSVRMALATGEVVVAGPMSPAEAEAHIERQIRESADTPTTKERNVSA